MPNQCRVPGYDATEGRVSRRLVFLAILAALPGTAEQRPDNGGPFAPVVTAAFETGFGKPLSPAICTALDLAGKSKELPVEQLSGSEGSTSRSFNVSRHRGSLDIVMSRRTPDDLMLFRISSEGLLVRTVRIRSGSGPEEVSLAAGTPEFQKEKTWWLEVWLPRRKLKR